MRHTYLIITALSLLVIGCKSKPEFLPDLKFGQSESSWKAIQAKLLDNGTFKPWTETADTMYQYSWQLEDTAVTVNVSLNNDGIKQGPLRMLSFDLCTYTRDIADSEQSFLTKYVGATKWYLCPKPSFNKIKEHLDFRYGKPAPQVKANGVMLPTFIRSQSLILFSNKAQSFRIPVQPVKQEHFFKVQHCTYWLRTTDNNLIA